MKSLHVVSLCLGLLGSAFAQGAKHWPDAVVRTAEEIAVQEGGRVKPLLTFAKYKLIRYSGKSTLKFDDGSKLGATEWMLDVLFRPEKANGYPVFVVPTSEVLDAIELPHDGKKKRDRYSYKEIQPGIGKLFELHDRYRKIEEKKRGPVRGAIVELAESIWDYRWLSTSFDPARAKFPADGSDTLKALFGGAKEVGIATVLGKSEKLVAEISKQIAATGEDIATPLSRLMLDVSNEEHVRSRGRVLHIFAPKASAEEDWRTLEELIEFRDKKLAAEGAREFAVFEALVAAANDPAAFGERLSSWQREQAVWVAKVDKPASDLGLELAYYRSGVLHWSLGLFFIGWLLIAGVWFFPRLRALALATNIFLFAPLVGLVATLWMRCAILDRPPVGTLYETILFITATLVLVALLFELVNRKRILMSIAAFAGAGGLLLAGQYEAIKAEDTMRPLVAVLRSNFWLTTHVLSVVVGYAAALLAALLAHVWFAGRAIEWWKARKAGRSLTSTSPFLRNVARMTYGAVCFGLLFSVVGTILGGVWANDSWGRFWGWDPKENGALMICLAQLVILHARLGGLIRHFGLAFFSVILGAITAFSWWHVNYLGVGLHSYGFAKGVIDSLNLFYGIEIAVLGVSAVGWAVSYQIRWRARQARLMQSADTEAADVAVGSGAVHVQGRIDD